MANQIPPTVLAMILRLTQIERQNREPEDWEQRVGQKLRLIAMLASNGELPEAGEVYSHKGEKCAEVQQFTRVFISTADGVQEYSPEKCKYSDKKDVVGGCAAAGFEMAEEFFWKHAIATHPKQQSCRSEGSGQSTAEGGNNKGWTPIALNRSVPPTRLQISMNAVSRLGNERQSGQTRAPNRPRMSLHTPAKIQVKTTASSTFRLGFSTSSASVVTPSKPM